MVKFSVAATTLLASLCTFLAPSIVTGAITKTCDANAKPGIIMGTGIGDGSWTTAEQVIGGKTFHLGLRGKLRHPPSNTYNSNGKGGYTFNVGCTHGGCPTDTLTAEWSVEWTINTEVECAAPPCSRTLDDFSYEFYQDMDPTYGTNFVKVYGVGDVINGRQYDSTSFVHCWDHSMGVATTTDANDVKVNCNAGTSPAVEAEYDGNIGTYAVAQNSWKRHWMIPPRELYLWNRDEIGIYDYKLAAKYVTTAYWGWQTNTNTAAEITIRIIVRDNANYPNFPPTMASDCDSANLATDYNNVFQTVAQCKEFVNWSGCA